MDKATLRPYVLEILRKSPQTHFHAIENDVRRAAETYERQDVLLLQEILWELLVQGVLAPGKNSLNLNLPFVHVTEYGARCLEDGRILAHDPERYLERMEEVVGDPIDPFVQHSVREALSVFLSGSVVSACILLGRAAEYLLEQLAAAWNRASVKPAPTTGTAELLPRSSVDRAQRLIHALGGGPFPGGVASTLEPQLNGLLALIQISSSQDGTPRWPQVSRDQVLGFLLLFPEQVALVAKMVAFLEGRAAK